MRIVIPHPRVHPIAFALSLIPIAIPVVMVPSLIPFFRQTGTPDAIGWIRDYEGGDSPIELDRRRVSVLRARVST